MIKNLISCVTCLVFSIFLLQGCYSKPGAGREIVRTAGTPDDQLKELSKLYGDTLNFCQSQLQDLEHQRNGISYWLIGIAVLGAGLVAAGAALLAASTANSATDAERAWHF